ncbi:protein of unknown function [Pseudomonas sp. JV551A1]|uniref:Uncharacterized protein n=1 Tax=Pseudomonas inefficax TaxID=2078786 RepID=A0AAQ1PEH4_9PSED|nr:protein of unknown function [Pseudomonas sp. JV551A1]SPO63833.1 protein of unknown function [Pseudomonas inefficax]
MASGAALQPIATQGRSYRSTRFPVGAALCRDGPQRGPNPVHTNPSGTNLDPTNAPTPRTTPLLRTFRR